MSKKIVIALDTNILLAIANAKIDIFLQIRNEFGSNAEIAIPKQVLNELKIISKQGKKMETAAEIALQELKTNNAKIVDVSAKDADSALLALARKGAIIATNDKTLKKEVKKLNGGIIFIRKMRFLAFY